MIDGGQMGPGTASRDLKYLDLSVPSPLILTDRYSQPQPLSTPKPGPRPHFIRFGEDMRLEQSPVQNAVDPRSNIIPLSGHWLDIDTGVGEMNKNEGTTIKKILAHEEKNIAIITVLIMTVV